MNISRSLLRIALAGFLAAGCAQRPSEQEQPAQKNAAPTRDAASPPPAREAVVTVDPSLLDSGRIALSPVRPLGSSQTATVPGEIVSDPQGEALVGALIGGRVRSLSVDVGDSVKQGDVLAVIDAPEVGRMRAQLAQAQAQWVLAQSQLERQQQLSLEGATSQRALEQARAQLDTAQAEVAAAQSLLSAWGVGAGSTAQLSLRAPISGVVIARHATLGGPVHPEETLFRLVAPERVVVLARWPETDPEVPAPGAILQVRARSTQAPQPCPATVETAAQVVDPTSRAITLRLRPTRPCPELRPGGFVNVTSAADPAGPESSQHRTAGPTSTPGGPNPDDGVVQIPSLAVVDVRGVPTVFVGTGTKGRFVARAVLTRPVHGDVTLVLAGLSVGEQVATRGVILLKGELLRDVLGGE